MGSGTWASTQIQFLDFSFSLGVFLQKVFMERKSLTSLPFWLLPFGKTVTLSLSSHEAFLLPGLWLAAGFNLLHGGARQSVGLRLLPVPRASCGGFVT